MNSKPLDIVEFLKLVIEALESAGVRYMIGGAIAAWAWGEPRATQDLDLVVDIPIEAVARLSDELKARDMLVAPEVILDALVEDRADIPINAIHMYSGRKQTYTQSGAAMSFAGRLSSAGWRLTLGRPSEKSSFIAQKT